MAVKVSVVVPVYNPGPYIEPCIASLLAQTMSPDDLELIFVDDGATDETPARLDRLAAEHSHVRVIHQENSGWPGKPRNVGVDAALGDYVQFVDQDDTMWPEALERLYAIGSRNNADIVIGKVTSNFRGVPHGVFKHDVESTTIRDWPLIDSLTPHKMFRKAFLQEHGIAYPEGKRRLEDQLYMVETYLPAKVVSIVGNYPCYFYNKRPDGKNAGSTRIEPVSYYVNLREVLDVVVAQTEPGEFRDQLLRRFYRNELLGRLKEPAVMRWPKPYRDKLFRAVRKLSLERFPDPVPDGLAVVPRIRSVFVRQNRLDDLVAFATRCQPVSGRAQLQTIDWEDGVLRFSAEGEFTFPDASPLVLHQRAGRWVMDDRVVGGAVPDEVADVTADLPVARAEVAIRDRATHVEWYVPSRLERHLEPAPELGPDAHRMVFRGTGELDPQTLAGGAPLPPGVWEVAVRLHALGFVGRHRLVAPRTGGPAPRPALLSSPPCTVIPRYEEGGLSLDVAEQTRTLAGALASRGPVRILTDGDHFTAALPVATTGGTGGKPVRLALTRDARNATTEWVPGRITPADGAATLTSSLPPSLHAGVYAVALQDDAGRTTGVIGSVAVRMGPARAGWYRLSHGAQRTSRRSRAAVRHRASTLARNPKALARFRAAVHKLPEPASRRLESAGQRLLKWSDR